MYKLVDEVAQEILQFKTKKACEAEAKYRVNNYKKGFVFKRNYIEAMNVKLIQTEEEIRICLD